MEPYPFEFEAPVALHDVGSERYRYRVVFLPRALHDALPLKTNPRLRITGEINDHPFEAALTPVRGAWYILLSKTTLQAIEAGVGDPVAVRFAIADQDAVEVPPALQAALASDPKMRRLWDAQSPGKQRGLAYRVASAKRAPTQAKRVAEVFAILRGELDMRGKPVR